jgi:hypothetical protein
MIRAALAVAVAVAATGCYVEAGLGAGRVMGPDLDDSWGWVFTVGAGGEFSAPDRRLVVGTTTELSGESNVRPIAIALTIGGDIQVAGSDTTQLRLTGRISPLALSWVELPTEGSDAYVVPAFLGVSWAVGCNARHWCTHLGLGTDVMVFRGDDVGWGTSITPQFRFTTTTGLFARRRKTTRGEL